MAEDNEMDVKNRLYFVSTRGQRSFSEDFTENEEIKSGTMSDNKMYQCQINQSINACNSHKFCPESSRHRSLHLFP